MPLAVLQYLSPRLLIVPSPDTEITIQEIVDQCRDWEDDIGMSYDKLIDAAGKEALGGGVTVGITATLQNARIAFESRTMPVETGTATSNSTSGLVLVDTSATFVTNLVEPGATVVNDTTGSSGTVITVDSETQLTLLELSGGTRNDWQIGDAYNVHNIIQCNISGGNIVAVDGFQVEIDPVFPTAFTQVIRTSSSSATLQELSDIRFSSFSGGIWYNAIVGVSGTLYPTGTQRQPVDNFIDGLAIASERGFNTFYVIGDATVDAGLDYTDYVFEGQGQNLSTLTVTSAANVTNCTFTHARVTGTLDGDSNISDCIVENLDFVSGVIAQCILFAGTITLGGSSTAYFIDCESGMTPATIDMGGSGQALSFSNYSGSVILTNKTGTDEVMIDLSSGQVRIDLTTVTNGPVVVRGTGKVVDDATGDWLPSGTYGSLVLLNETVHGMMLQDMWALMGLDKANPMTVTPTSRVAGGISQTISGDGVTTSTVTRT